MHNVVERRLDELARLCKKHKTKRLELFGSAARGDFDTSSSDLDFLVEFKELSPREHADAYFGLMEELENLFEHQIDLVERGAIRNPYFLEAVNQERVEIYAAA